MKPREEDLNLNLWYQLVTPRIPFRGFDLRDPVNHGAVRDGGFETYKVCNLIENLFNYKF